MAWCRVAPYGLRQMTDVTVKALSPGTNDPTTAVHALGHISRLLCEMVTFELGPKLSLYGRDAPNVLARLFQLLHELSWCVQTEAERSAISEQLRRLREAVADQDLGRTETAALNRLSTRVEDALEGRW